MFLEDKYGYLTNDLCTDYEFESSGTRGIITKVARFTIIGTNIYSFGFGDLDRETGEIDDKVASNNGDGDKILRTVAVIIYDFTSCYPGAVVFIQGSTLGRTRRYQMGISKYWNYMKPIFEVFGLNNEQWKPFKKDENYTAFLGRRKLSVL